MDDLSDLRPSESSKGITIILMGGPSQFAESIRRAQGLAQADSGSLNSTPGKTSHEIFLVDSSCRQTEALENKEDARSYQEKSHNLMKISNRLSDAIRRASQPNILVVDGDWTSELDGLIRIAVSKIRNFSAIESLKDCSSSTSASGPAVEIGIVSSSASSWVSRVLTKLYQWLILVLLGVPKPRFKSGFVLFDQKQKDSLLGVESFRDSTAASISDTEQLLALLRLRGHSFVERETRLWEAGKSVHPPIQSKEIFKRGWQTILFWWNEIRFPAGRSSLKSKVSDDVGSRLNISKLACWTGLLLLSGVLMIRSLDYPLLEPDETRNAQIAYNLIKSGNWLTLTLNDEPYRNKPPGLSWMIATSYNLFGVSPWSTRLPNALLTIFTLLIVFGWGQKLVGVRAAFLASITLMLSVGFVIVGRYVVMDAGFTCCIVGMNLALILAEGTSWRYYNSCNTGLLDQHLRGNLWLIAAGIFAGIGVMFKGPAIFIVALPPVIAAYALEGRLNFFRHPRVLYYFIPSLMLGAPWYIAMAIIDPTFLGDFLWRENLMRFTNAFDHEAPWWFYLPVTLLMMFPASYLLPALGRYLFSQDQRTRALRTSAQGALVLLSGWVILFFSCSGSKLVTYILPAIPFLALLIGAMLDGVIFANPIGNQWKTGRPGFWTIIKQVPLHNLPYVSPLGFVLTSVLVVLVLNQAWDCSLPSSAGLLATAWTIMLIVALVPWFVSNVRLNWLCLGATGLGLMLTLLHVLVPNLAQLRSFNQSLARLTRQGEYESAPIVFFDRHPYGAELEMSNREIKYFKLEEAIEFRDFIAAHPLAVIVASDKNIKRYCNTLRGQVELVRSGARHIHFSHPQTQTAANRMSEASAVRK